MRISDWSSDVCSSVLFSNESRKVLEVIAREAIANFADARQAFVAFVETSWDHSELVEVPRLLQEVAGAMAMLELPQAAGYLAGVRMYTRSEEHKSELLSLMRSSYASFCLKKKTHQQYHKHAVRAST